MKIAVTCVNGQVFQHFGHCPSFLICEIKDGKMTSQEMLNTQGHGCSLLASFLKQNGVDVVICGGIGAGTKEHMISYGIEILSGASGDAIVQVQNYLAGTLNYNPETECDHHEHEGNHQCHNTHSCHY